MEGTEELLSAARDFWNRKEGRRGRGIGRQGGALPSRRGEGNDIGKLHVHVGTWADDDIRHPTLRIVSLSSTRATPLKLLTVRCIRSQPWWAMVTVYG